MLEGFDDVAPGVSSNRPPLPIGDYAELAVEEFATFTPPKGAKIKGLHLKLNVVVIDPGTAPCKPGTGGSFLVQLDDHAFESYKARDWALAKDLIGKAFGLDDAGEIKAAVTKVVFANVTGPSNPFRGNVFGARIGHKVTGRGVTINTFEATRAVLGQDGKAKRVALGPQSTQAPTASVPVASAIVPPAPPAARAFPPAGWFAHPGIPGSFHDGKNVLTEAQLRATV